MIAALVLAAGTWIGLHAVQAFRAAGGQPLFYQSEFGPAVMFACGRGLENPDTRTAGVLSSFLSLQSDSVNCADLPPPVGASTLDPFQLTCRYLELTVAFVWKLTGVSWSRLAILHGILFGAVASLSYGVFRLGLGRLLSVLAVIPVIMSTPNLNLVPHLRDYAKGPFLLGVMLIMGVLVVGRPSPRRTLALCALAGGVVGFGLGFRTDLMIAVLPFLAVVAVVAPALSFRLRAGAMLTFLVSFVVAAFPVLGMYSHGNNVGPVALLGLTKPFDETLGIQPSIYEYGAQYNDSLIFSVVNSYAVRIEGRTEGVDLATPEHASASMQYLTAIARTFPADFVTRTLAATRMTARYFLESSLDRPPWLRSRIADTLYWLRGAVSSRLAPAALSGLVIATLVISMADPHAAWLIVVFMVAFAGGSAIQFHERHFFYLQLVPWWAFAFLVQTASRGPALIRGVTRMHVRRAIVFSAITAASVAGAMLGPRMYQQREATRLFARYETAARTPIAAAPRPAEPTQSLLSATEWSESLPPGTPRVRTRFFAVQLNDRMCGVDDVPLTIRYQAVLPELDFSERLIVQVHPDAASPTRLYFATFDRPDDTTRFRGIELPANRLRCVDRIDQVNGLDQTPLLLTTVLQANWQNQPLYQRLN